MIRQLSGRHTITIPQEALKKIRAKTGDFFDISAQGFKIILSPRTLEDPFTDSEWEKLRKLATGPGVGPLSPAEAKRYLRRLAK